MESRAPAVVAVVVTTGSGPGLEVAVASLAAQNYEELSLLVVANGETEHVPARVAAVAPKAFVRALDENRGYAAACNDLRAAVASWTAINARELAGLNSALGRNGLQAVPAAAGVKAPVCGEKSAR